MTLTKEWLLKTISELEEERDATPGAVNEDAAKALAAMKLALAALEAENSFEPVAFINGAWTLVCYRPPKELGRKIGDKFYAAPPAPVVPDEIESTSGSDYDDYYCDGWNACCADMLQGAAGNSPAIPDGYALVPVEPTAEMQSAAASAIRFETTPINKLWTGNAVYKAMLAAAPQLGR